MSERKQNDTRISLYPLPFGGLIADTPGFDWLELDTVDEAGCEAGSVEHRDDVASEL